MHKNFVGTMSALGAAIAYARPAWIGLSNRMALAAGLILVSSVFFTQSRQAVIGLVAAVFVLVFRSRSDRRRTKLILLHRRSRARRRDNGPAGPDRVG